MNEKEAIRIINYRSLGIEKVEDTVYQFARGYMFAIDQADGVLVDALERIQMEYKDTARRIGYLSREDMVELSKKALAKWEVEK